MKTIFKEDYLECFYDEANSVLFHVWIRKPSSEEFKDGLTRVYDTYLSYKKTGTLLHWLGDTRNMGVLSIDVQQWLDEVWNEMLFVKAGVKTHAVIVGKDVFAKYAMDKFKNAMMEKFAAQKIHLDTFEDREAAYEWFKSVEKDRAA